MPEINVWAVLVAALSSFLLGGLWYSPLLFARAWMEETGLSEEALAQGNPAMIYGGSLILSAIAAGVFALFLGPAPALPFAVGAGVAAGLCWVGASFGVNYLFEHKSLRLYWINAGYHTLQFALFGLVLGLWP